MAVIKSRAFWSQHVAACATSGLSRAAYCRQQGLSYWTFNDWRRRLGSTGSSVASTRQALVPVVMTSPPTQSGTLELRVGEQVRLSLPASVDAVWLGSLLRSAAVC